MQNITDIAILNYAPNLQAIIRKLPFYLQNKWRDCVHRVSNNEQQFVHFNDIVTFVKNAAETINEPVFSKDALSRGDNSKYQQHTKSSNVGKNSSFVVNISDNQEPTSKHSQQFMTREQCHLCGQQHHLDDCEAFMRKSMDYKKTFFREQQLCFGCMGFNHTSKGCLKRSTCRICRKRHPTCLHIEGFSYSKGPQHTEQSSSTSTHDVGNPTITNHSCSTSQIGKHDIILQTILPVIVTKRERNQPVHTYAFYDHGSTGCFISEELTESLGAKGHNTTLMLRTMHGKGYVDSAVIDNLIVTDLDGKNPITLPNTYVRAEIPVSHEQIPRPEVIARLPHLRELARNMPAYQKDLNIGLLIGSNCPIALEPLGIIPVKGDGPFAAQFRHGWTINGPIQVNSFVDGSAMACYKIMVHDQESSKEIMSPESVIKILESDFNNCEVGTVPDQRGPSQEDVTFIDNAARDIQIVEGHYVLPLPFRQHDVRMPDNKHQVLKRTLWQKKKMSRDPKYYSDYSTFMLNLLNNGFAEQVPESRLRAELGQVWYLPHHGVYNPKKQIRCVSCLMQVPNFLVFL